MAQFVNPQVVMEQDFTDREITRAIRQALAAEEEAIHLYETIADSTDNEMVVETLQDIADEEKVHVGELQALLNELLEDEEELLEEGKDEFMDNNKLASELIKIAKKLKAKKNTPISDYLSANWSKISDLFYDLEKEADEYNNADYGDKASKDAKKIYEFSLESIKNIKKIYGDFFQKLITMEENFVKSNGTIEEYLDSRDEEQ
jgi:rubrerythrin